MNTPTIHVLAVVDNLLTATRISESAKAAGVPVEVVRPSQAWQRFHDHRPSLVLFDLEAPDVLAAVRRIRSEDLPSTTRLVGFYPHIRMELREAALEAGLDQALPRSAFHARLTQLLRAAAPSAS